MIRGTTATFKFQLPYPYDEVVSGKVVFWQEETKYFIEKTFNETEKDESFFKGSGENELCVSLTPDETKFFSEEYKAKAQFKGETSAETGHKTFASREYLATVHPLYGGANMEDWNKWSPTGDVVIFDAGEIGGEP